MRTLVFGMALGVIIGSTSVSRTVAQEAESVTIGARFSITSEVLGEERAYSVYLPASYHSTTYAPRRYRCCTCWTVTRTSIR